jgi:ABC-type nitrate/sulfonate/bicarbonate transport system permease component
MTLHESGSKPGLRADGLSDWLLDRPNLIRAVAVVAFFIVWEIVGSRINPIFLSSPSAIAKAFVELSSGGALWQALGQSLASFVIGMTISIVGGIAIGVAMGKFRWFEYLVDPFVNAIYAIPRVALVPLVILWFGLELTSKIVIVVSIAIFPIIINTYSGVKDVRADLIEIGRAYSLTESQIFFKIVLPAAVPFIMAGIRLSVGVGIIGMIVAEFFTAVSGLGGLIVFYGNQFATAKMLVPIIVLALMGVTLTQLVVYLEARLSRWKASEKSRFE